MIPSLLYVLVLLAYLPGVAALVYWRKCWRFPILPIAFLGMLFFNALGSIGVFDEQKIYWLSFDTADVARELALVLIFQALAFYFVAGIYVYLRMPPSIKSVVTSTDLLAVSLTIVSILVIGWLYYLETGGFLVLASLDGSMNMDNALSFRENYVYGLTSWPLYNLSFVLLPVLLSSYGLILIKTHSRYRAIFALSLAVSFAASLSLGSKGGVINFVMSLGIAYLTYLGMTGQRILLIFRSRSFVSFSVIAVAIMFLGYQRHTGGGLDAGVIHERILHRMFVAYPETLASALSYAHKFGELGVAAVPTLRGLLPHDQINLSLALHQYQAAAPGGVSVPFAGEAYLMAGWPMVFLLVPLIFLVLVALQEVAFWFREGSVSIAFSALYAYLAVVLTMNGMFASLFNFMYPGTLLLLGAVLLVLRKPWDLLALKSGLVPSGRLL